MDSNMVLEPDVAQSSSSLASLGLTSIGDVMAIGKALKFIRSCLRQILHTGRSRSS
ncbi:hypothetical protein Syun_018726 [Stephania yunnanensis]|uniref:Uncharacterized protein n=1 Tax=Stephania yunnanensis TaxID=152371 RepID=A0AAP0IST2_9MAGN